MLLSERREMLAAMRKLKKIKQTPENKKTLRMKLEEIVPNLDLDYPIHATVNGVDLELYRISELGYAIGRTSTTIRIWEHKKMMPPATFRSKKGDRLYAPLQIALVVYLAKKHKIAQGKKLKYTAFVTELNELWPKVKDMLFEEEKSNE